MAINIYQRFRLWRNPNYINGIIIKKPEDIDQLLDYAEKNGLDLLRINNSDLKYTDRYINSLIKLDNDAAKKYLVAYSPETISKSAKELIKSYLKRTSLNISIDSDDSEAEKIGLNKVNQEYLNDFDVFKNIFAQIPNINYENLEILKKSISSFREQRKIDDMVKFFIENNISIDDLYYNSRRLNSTETLEPDVVYSYLKRDFTKTFTSQSFTNNKGTAINPEEVKSIFLSNLDKNIQVINEIFEYFEEEDFTEEEKKKILDSIKKYKIPIRSEKVFRECFKDREIIFNSIVNDTENIDKFPIEKTPYNDTSFLYNFTDEQVEQLSQVLSQNKKIFEEFEWIYFINREDNAKLGNGILHRNPYFFDDLDDKFTAYEVDTDFLSKNYVITEHSPVVFLNNFDIVMNSMRKNFNIVNIEPLRYRFNKLTEEQYRQIYILAKQNEYKWSKDSPNFLKKNPFLFIDALKNGEINLDEIDEKEDFLDSFKIIFVDEELFDYYCRHYEKIQKSKATTFFSTSYKYKREEILNPNIESQITITRKLSSEEKIQNNLLVDKNINPDEYLDLLENNFYYIFNNSGNSIADDFTNEQRQRFAEIYLREMPKLNYGLSDYKIVISNPYIAKYLYENNINIINDGYLVKGLESVTEEYFKSIKEIYDARGGKFVKNANLLELLNPLIILEEIDKNPQSIDNIDELLSVKKDEIIQKIKEKILDDSYIISEKTPEILLSEKELYETFLSKDINNLRFISTFLDETEKIKYTEIFIQNLEEGKINLEGNPQFPFVFNIENVKRIMDINPQYLNVLNNNKILDAEVKEYILDQIISGKYVVDERTSSSIQEEIVNYYTGTYFNSKESKKPENSEKTGKVRQLIEMSKSNVYLYLTEKENAYLESEKRDSAEYIKLKEVLKNDSINLDNGGYLENIIIYLRNEPEEISNYFNKHPEYILKYFKNIKNGFCFVDNKDIVTFLGDLSKKNIKIISDSIVQQGFTDNNIDIIRNNKDIFLNIVKENPKIVAFLEDNLKSDLEFELTDEDFAIIEESFNKAGINYIINERSIKQFKTNPYYIEKSLRENFSTINYLNIAGNADEIIENAEYYQSLMTLLAENGIQPENHGQLPEYLIPLFSRLENKEIESLRTSLITKKRNNFALNLEIRKYKKDDNFVLQPNMDMVIRADPKLILKTLRKDWSFVDYIPPIADLSHNINIDGITDEERDEIIRLALNNNYVLNENSNFFFRNNHEIVMNSFKQDINSIKYASPIVKLNKEEKENILQVVRSNENNLTLADVSIDFLRVDNEFIIKSLNLAKGKELTKVFERIELRILSEENYNLYKEKILEEIENGKLDITKFNKPDLFKDNEFVISIASKDINVLLRDDIDINQFSVEEQRKIYDIYIKASNKEDKNLPESIFKKVNTDVNQMINDILANPTNVDNYNFDMINLPKEIRENVIKSLIEDGTYTVSERTPSFVRGNSEFVYNYLKAHDGELSGLELTDLVCILDFDKVKDHMEYLEFSNYYNKIKVSYYEYIDTLGIESTLKYFENLGSLMKKFPPEILKNSDIKDIQNLLISNLTMNNNNYTLEDLQTILSKFDIKLTEEIIKVNPKLSKDSTTFFEQLEKDPNVILLYTGFDEKVLKKALEKGFEFNAENTYSRLNFTSSKVVMNYLLDKNEPDAELHYTGESKEIFDRIINENRFAKYLEEQIDAFFSRSTISYYDNAIKYFIDKYGGNKASYYNGNNMEIYDYAIDRGYRVTLDEFIKKPLLLSNEKLYELGAKEDKLVIALKLNRINMHGRRIGPPENSEQIKLIERYMGKKEFNEIFNTDELKQNLYKLTSVIDNSDLSIKFFKALDTEILQEMGFDEWNRFIKYSINTPEYNNIIEIAQNGKFKDFKESFKRIEGFINDEQGVGINKYLNYAKLFSINPKICEEFVESISQEELDTGHLSKVHKIQLTDFETLMYNAPIDLIKNADISYLGRITEIKRENGLKSIEKDLENPKSLVFDYLFNMNEVQIKNLLENDINTRTLLTIENRAKEEGNTELEFRAKELCVLVDTIEQISYSDMSYEEIKKFAYNIFNQDINTIKLIRSEFGNLKEVVRSFYEYEAQTELTSVQDLIKNRHDLVEQTDDKFLIIDVRNTKHTFYAHALSPISFNGFFDTDKGKVTICVSPETDQHESYYYGGNEIILGFDNIINGAFIGSSTKNMGSNDYIEENNYNTENVSILYDQRSIRNSYNGNGHAETLLYRAGLIPSCVILTGDDPTEIEKNVVVEIEKVINGEKSKDDPTYIKIPFVKTQKTQKRVVNYKEQYSDKLVQDPLEIKNPKEEKIEKLRQKFSGLLSFKQEGTDIVRHHPKAGIDYIVYNDEVYIIEKSKNNFGIPNISQYKIIDSEENHDITSLETEILYTASKLQGLVYGKDKSRKLDILKLEYSDEDGNSYIVPAIKEEDARSLWNYSREDGSFNAKSNEELLSEFLVDHLMCNYDSGNSEFLMDDAGNCYGRGKQNAFRAIDDFITTSGETYNAFSFYYFDNQEGNNVYRKVFESYINAKNPESVISKKALKEFIETADRIGKMPDEEYMSMFEHVLDKIDDEEKREKMESIIMDRKHSLPEESREFVNNIRELNRINNTVEVIKNPDSIAFINDVHGNAEAIKEIFKDCEESGKKDIFILGDMIGIGPESNECIDIIRNYQEEHPDIKVSCILGNHELYSIMGNKSFRSTLGFDGILTNDTRRELSPENRRFIEALPITRKLEISGKKVELTHFPISVEYTKKSDDEQIYLEHGGTFSETRTVSGKDQDILIYGHEHRTETTIGDQVGSIRTEKIGNTKFFNLPSSGCVHGKHSSYVTLSLEGEELVPKINEVEFDKTRLAEDLRKTQNPRANYFGVNIHEEEGGR